MKAKSKPLKADKNRTDEMHDGAEFLDCVKFLHGEAERLGYLKLVKILERTVDNCAKVLNARDEK